METQEGRRTPWRFDKRTLAHHMLAGAENRGAAVAYSAASLLVAGLFARTHALFGAYPFAIAYLAAVDRRTPFAFLGALLGALSLGERGYTYAVAYLALFFLRLFLGSRGKEATTVAPFEEGTTGRVAAACGAGLFLAVYQLLVGGLATRSLAFACFTLLLPGPLCLLYLGFFASHRSLYACLLEARGSRPSGRDYYFSLSLGGLGFTFLRGLSAFSLFGLSLSFLLAAFFCLLFPQKWGLLRGGAAAAVAALGACLSSETILYFPAFLAVAVAAALLARFGVRCALPGAAAAGGLLAYGLTGTRAVLALLPELCACLLLSWPLFSALPRLRAGGETAAARAREGACVTARAMATGTSRLYRFAEAFSSLGEVFARLGSTPEMENGRISGGCNERLERQWRLLAALLQDAADRAEREAREDVAASRAAARVFHEMGAPARHAAVFGRHDRLLLADGVRWEADHPAEEALRKRLGEVCGCALGAPLLSLHGGVTDLRYTAAKRFAVSACHVAAARGQEVSGDVFATFAGEGARCCALLSDGMGSGQEAAITAGLCLSFLSGVLGAGAGKKAAIAALNDLLLAREGECTATLDLCEIDLLTGEACFVKCGAPASYVLRGDSLFHVPAGRLPIGVLQEVEEEKTRLFLQEGDRVILLSDGVSRGPEDTLWLCEQLSAYAAEEPELMAERILHLARAHAAGSDDMTVAVLSIGPA